MTGEIRSHELVKVLRMHGWGRVFIDGRPTPYPAEPWGFDNGAYRDFVNGNLFNERLFFDRLQRAYQCGRPYMAVVPDIVAGGLKSLEFSLAWIDRLPSDWPWYIAVQNGMAIADIESELYRFAGIFLGGDVQFKERTAHEWADLAHRHGKRFHYARCGTGRKIRHAHLVRADSADSVAPIWIGECRKRIVRAFEVGDLQRCLQF